MVFLKILAYAVAVVLCILLLFAGFCIIAIGDLRKAEIEERRREQPDEEETEEDS